MAITHVNHFTFLNITFQRDVKAAKSRSNIPHTLHL